MKMLPRRDELFSVDYSESFLDRVFDSLSPGVESDSTRTKAADASEMLTPSIFGKSRGDVLEIETGALQFRNSRGLES